MFKTATGMLKLYVLAGIALTGWLLYLLAPILTPFMAAAVLSYLFNPLVTRMAAWHLGRAGATTVVFLIFALVLVGIALVLLPVIQNQAVLFIDALPN